MHLEKYSSNEICFILFEFIFWKKQNMKNELDKSNFYWIKIKLEGKVYFRIFTAHSCLKKQVKRIFRSFKTLFTYETCICIPFL